MIVDVTRAVIPCVVMEGTVEDITLIFAKEIITLTIVKVTEGRAQEMRTKEVRATKEASMDVAVKEVTSIVSDSQMMATTIGAMPGQHLPSDITVSKFVARPVLR
jgi:inosine/xanthosine triphosphate pyrophosphatase family protein